MKSVLLPLAFRQCELTEAHTGFLLQQIKDAGKQPPVHGTAPDPQSYPTESVSVETENPELDKRRVRGKPII